MSGRGVCTFSAEDHTYAIDGTPALSVTQVIRLGGLEEDYSRVPPEIREKAALKGTRVHLACDWDDQNALDWPALRSDAPTLVPYVEAWRRFRDKERVTFEGPRVLDPDTPPTFEERVWSKALGVAGSLDRRGTWDGGPTIFEIKTSRTLSWTYGCQLAGYAMLWLLGEGVDLGEPLSQRARGIRRVVVQLTDRGTYKPEEYGDSDDLVLFSAALHIARAKAKHGKANGA